MRKQAIEKLARPIGQDIGLCDDVVQSDLLNGLFISMDNSMNNRDLQTQICSIVERLEPSSENILIEFVAFIELKRKAK